MGQTITRGKFTKVNRLKNLCSSVLIFGQFLWRFSAFSTLQTILFLAIFAAPVLAQTISGTVTDTQNAPISAAEISLLNQNKIVSRTTTDAEGKFSIVTNGESGLRLR